MDGNDADMSVSPNENGKDQPNLQNDGENELSQNALSGDGVHEQDGDQSIVFTDSSDWTQVRNSRKRQKVSSSGASLESFKTLDIHDKLNVLHTDINNQNQKVGIIEQKLDSCLRLNNRVNTIEVNMGDVDRRLLLLEYKSIDIEARSRRNNLIFMGFAEEMPEYCQIKIEKCLEENLGIEPFTIDRAHRLGRFKRGSHRPIIVAFRDYAAVETVLSSCYKLKGSKISINKDFPREIVDARKSLWKHFKELKVQNPRSKVSIVYPAKLIKDGHVVHNMFPLWDSIMSGTRIRVNQHPQTNQWESRAQENSRPNIAATADGNRGDNPAENVPRAASTHTDPHHAQSSSIGETINRNSSVSPVRGDSTRRQTRSRSPRRPTRAALRSRAPSRHFETSGSNLHRNESPIHRPWNQNEPLTNPRQQSAPS